MSFNLGRELKRKGISQKMFQQILADKYNYPVVISTVQYYYSKECPSQYACWDIVLKCLKEQFNIEYKNGRWQEVK